jgi:transcriptional regulator with XRE-family HTH domain
MLEDDVAASIQKSFQASLTRLLKELKNQGVTQAKIAADMNVPSSLLSQMKSGDYEPTFNQLARLLEALNRYRKVEPEDLFRHDNRDDLIKELARRAGYKIVSKDS